jgi:L-ornithine Nalpha-acyltransferase
MKDILSEKIRKEKKLIVRLAENQLEIEKALSLRYNVFNLEMNEGLPTSHQSGKDRDEYDTLCDHLIVINQTTKEVVGTYRILKKSKAEANFGFYSENEFNLDNIYKIKEEFAELGRSCVHPSYRDGSVISMLWAGIGKYIEEHNIQYLMGCGSLHTTDALTASRAYAYVKGKSAIAESKFTVIPQKDYVLDGFMDNFEVDSIGELSRFVPPLIKGYVRVGTKVCGAPALDKEFGTIDFFLLFNKNEVVSKYKSHYLENN